MSNLSQTPSVLYTDRLLLRSPEAADAKAIQTLIHNPKIAEMTATIPYPYPLSAAKEWIKHVSLMRAEGLIAAYLICHRECREIMGVISLKRLSNMDINIAYWLGEAYWGNGVCTEAGKKILAMAEGLKISPVIARHLKGNEGSRGVLLKLGFKELGEEIMNHRGSDASFICYRYEDP